MSVKLAEGVVEVKADASDVPRSIANDIDRGQGLLGDAGHRSAGAFGGVFKGSLLGSFMGNIASDIVGQIGYAIGTGIRQAVEFGIGGIEIASGVAEASTAIDAVFGGGASAVKSFAEGAAKDVGQSELAALKAAQTFGIFGKAAGLADADLSGFATNLVGLSTDFASFFDTSPEDAVLAIGSALRGEFEPIRQYGILLDDAALKNQALAMGIWDGEGSLTAQQKTLAAQAAIFAQAGDAAGDFDKTSGGLANQQRILKAELENAQGALGEALLPAMLELTSFANETLVPILNDVIEVVGPMLGEALTEATPAFLDMVNAIVPAIPDLIRLGTEAFPIILGALEWLIPALTNIGTAFSDSKMPEWPGLITIIGDFFTGLFDKLGVGAGQIGDFFGVVGSSFTLGMSQIGDFFTGVFGWFGTMGGKLAEGAGQIGNFIGGFISRFNEGGAQVGRFVGDVGTNIGKAVGFIGELPGKALNALGDLGRTLFRQGQRLIQGFIDGISGMLGNVGDAIGGVLDFAAGFFPNSPAKRGPFSGAGWTAIGRSGLAIGEQFASGLDKARFGIPFSTTAGAALGAAGAGSSGTMTASASAYGGARIIEKMEVTVNESTDPLGAPGRISSELRKWARG